MTTKNLSKNSPKRAPCVAQPPQWSVVARSQCAESRQIGCAGRQRGWAVNIAVADTWASAALIAACARASEIGAP